MTDVNEIRALQASFRGALETGAALEALREKTLTLDVSAGIAAEDLEVLERVTLAHAVASQALRGLVESMRARRQTAGGAA